MGQLLTAQESFGEGRKDVARRLVARRPPRVSRFWDGSPLAVGYAAADNRVSQFAPGAEPRFSPDGKWVAYTGFDIFVQPFPGPGGRIQISSAGGVQAAWSPDGRQIFYIAPDKKLMAVRFEPAEEIRERAARAVSNADCRAELCGPPVRCGARRALPHQLLALELLLPADAADTVECTVEAVASAIWGPSARRGLAMA